MAFIFKWLLRGVVALLVVALIGLAGVWYLAGRSLPDYSADETVSGLNGDVEIVRDAHGVPHILGQTDADSFFALGYVHAQDRLWQMTMMRRTAQGRLSELFGARTLAVDDLLRRFDLYGLAERSLQYQSPQARAALQAYADGVNARIDVVNRGALGRGAPEFFLFSGPLEPWRPADSLAILRLMSLQLAGHLEVEVFRAGASLILPPERVEDIDPLPPSASPVDLASYRDLFGGDVQFAALQPPEVTDPLDPRPAPGLAGASNFWAASAARSTGGAPLLANDPHLGLSAPTIWMLAHVRLQSGDIIGATVPGMPLVLLGRSDDLAWGLTSSYLDDQDVMIEELNPQNPEEYRTPTGFEPFRTKEVLIEVKGQDPVPATLRWSDNGPIIPGARYGLAGVTPAGNVAALSWTALEPVDRSFSAALKMMQTHSVAQAIDAIGPYRAPSQNLALADREHIAWVLIGAMPRRDAGHETQGRMPAPGWKPENRWHGYFDFAENPRVIDPDSGVLGNTNNQTVDQPFPRHVSFKWGDTQRIERLKDLMSGRAAHSRESFMETQADAVSNAARSLLPLVAGDLWQVDLPQDATALQRVRFRALSELAAWNGDMNEHLSEPLIYAAWMREVQDLLITDDLGPLAAEKPRPDPVFLERVFRDFDGASAWCDVRQTAPVETCDQIASIALDRALIWLSDRHGSDPDRWRWGDEHQATHDHQVLGSIPVLGWLVNIRQSTSGGDHTLNRARTGEDPENPFLDVHAAGYRAVYDMADPESSVFVISTGESGHPLSGYYDDLAQLWRRGEYIPMVTSDDLFRSGSAGTTWLRPAPE